MLVDALKTQGLRKMPEANSIEISVFHAHVYYDPAPDPTHDPTSDAAIHSASREAAAQVRQGLSDRFEVRLGRWHDQPIGPHPKAMYQVIFLPEQFGAIVPWLMLHRQGLDILIHAETGDDVADHTDHALWLGEKLPLNIEFLRQIARSTGSDRHA
jgi:aromatic ring-cleaving dioxygenase